MIIHLMEYEAVEVVRLDYFLGRLAVDLYYSMISLETNYRIFVSLRALNYLEHHLWEKAASLTR